MQGGERAQGWGWAVRWGCWLGGTRGCEWFGLTILVAWGGLGRMGHMGRVHHMAVAATPHVAVIKRNRIRIYTYVF